jgi:dUTP pyrophosphatase
LGSTQPTGRQLTDVLIRKQAMELVTNNHHFTNHQTISVESLRYTDPNTIFVKTGKHGLPRQATSGSAGYDLRADLIEPITIRPQETFLVNTGLRVQMPSHISALILPRSGLALKHGISVPNAPGLIDSDYRGDICVILKNDGVQPFRINDGDRIAQMVFLNLMSPPLVFSNSLTETLRGEGGFGSTNAG